MPATPLLLTFWLVLFGTIFRDLIMALLIKWFGSRISIGDLELDEDLESYFRVIDIHDKNWSVKEEENCRNVLNMRILNDYTLSKFKGTETGTKTMKGVHSYDILANPLYLDDFQYFSSDLADRSKYIIDDDSDEENDNA